MDLPKKIYKVTQTKYGLRKNSFEDSFKKIKKIL